MDTQENRMDGGTDKPDMQERNKFEGGIIEVQPSLILHIKCWQC